MFACYNLVHDKGEGFPVVLIVNLLSFPAFATPVLTRLIPR